ncbi:MAG: efflux transporter outer membrane subunit [Candidatus Acidiferrales bacterium]
MIPVVPNAGRPVRTRRWIGASVLLTAMCIADGCVVGPQYHRATVDLPPNYKEDQNWKPAQPADASLRGNWWEIFNDPQLNSLEEQVSVSNQSLKAAQARFNQARALVRFERAGYYPTLSVAPSISRTRVSQNKANAGTSGGTTTADFMIPFDVAYEPDLWGRVRREVEAARAGAQASAADLVNVTLSVRAELAVDYFQLRSLDAEKALLDSTVKDYSEALALTEDRHRGGIASEVDVAQAQTQLETTRAQAIDVQVARAQFEHAVAVLVGKPASDFSIPPLPLEAAPPGIPEGVPSDLLQRRPDIASAERSVAEANAGIGVAKSAYYPNITLSGEGGFESAVITTLVSGPSSLWSVGASALETIFDAGARRASTDQAWAAYEESVANYRQSVLTGIQEVEDNLAALRILEDEAKTQAAAVSASQHSLDLSTTRYKGGVAGYLEVITAQSSALADQLVAEQIRARRMTAAVLLIKALGGGWDASSLGGVASSSSPPASPSPAPPTQTPH